MFSGVGICFDYSGVYVFHVCLGSIVILGLSVSHVVGGVVLWVICVFRHVDVVWLSMLRTSLQF